MATGEGLSVEQVGTIVQAEVEALPFQKIEVAREHLARATQILDGIVNRAETPALQRVSADLSAADQGLAGVFAMLQEGRAELVGFLRDTGLNNTVADHSSQEPAPLAEIPALVKTGHTPCVHVTRETGSPVTNDSLQLLRDTGVAREIAFGLIQEQDTYPIDYSRRLGTLAMDTLDCAGCQIADSCPVASYLHGYIMLEELSYAATEPRHVPHFITVGRERRHRETMGLSDVADSLRAVSRGYAAEVVAIDLEDIRESHGNVQLDRAAPRRQYTKAELDEVSNFAAITDGTTFSSIQMITSDGQRFELIDAARALPFKGEPPQENEFAILCSKLLGRMVELGPDGEPLICTPDSKMQKIIKSIPGGMVCELRMRGKSRIYFTLRRIEGNSGPMFRVVFLGGHGGDARTQQEFIDTVLRLEK